MIWVKVFKIGNRRAGKGVIVISEQLFSDYPPSPPEPHAPRVQLADSLE